MKLHVGAIPVSPDFVPNYPWTPLREIGPILMQFFAFPLGVVMGAAVAALWWCFTPVTIAECDSPASLLGAMLLMFPVHELVHAAVHPHAGRSARSVLGVWPSRLLFYAHYGGELSRNRLLAILVMPLLVISGIPLVICALVANAPVVLAFISVLNALGASGDVFAICLLLFQVPNRAVVRNQGWRSYWKIKGTGTAWGA